MPVKRCAILHAEPFETLDLDLAALFRGESGLVTRRGWRVLAPHLAAEVVVSAAELDALGRVGAADWMDHELVAGEIGADCLASLISNGLLIDSADEQAVARDKALHDLHWHAPAAIAHHASRWSNTDVDASRRQANSNAVADLVARVGPPPPHYHTRRDARERCQLPGTQSKTGLDQLLERRTTCRNFDAASSLPLQDLAGLLDRVFGSRGSEEIAEGAVAIKKNHPSGGALHPIEAYLIVRNVAGLAPGLYHYNVESHALDLLEALDTNDVHRTALDAVAGQTYFADAHALIILTARFGRSFWKYRNHAKIYRAILLEAGHVSQNIYLSATESGYGAFVTAAINEIDLEKALRLDSIQESPVAVCGIGVRGSRKATVEFDPAGKVWGRGDGPGIHA